MNDTTTETVMKELDIKTNNIFGELLGDPWQKQLEEIINYTSLHNKVGMFNQTNLRAQENHSIDPKHKELIQKLYNAFREAMCIDGPPKPLMDLLDTKPNLKKIVTSELRKDRAYAAIDRVIRKLQFDHFVPAAYVPLFASSMLISYGYKHLSLVSECNKMYNTKSYFGDYLAALLSRYAIDCIDIFDISTSFFLLCMVKNLSYNSLPNKTLITTYPELKTYAHNLFKIYDKMIKLQIMPVPELPVVLT